MNKHRYKMRSIVLSVIAVLFILILPAGLTFAEQNEPPDVNRGGEEFRRSIEEDNRDLTRGMMYMGGLMVLVVVVGTLRILQLDRVNRPHLLRPKQKRELPDATIKKTESNATEHEPVEEKKS